MKFNAQTRNNIISIICYLYVVLFTYAATSKLLDLENFRLQLGRFPFISTYAIWIAWGVPFLEIVIAGLFLFPKYILTALYASLSLLTIFTTYIILVLNFSDSIPCSCGGVISKLGWNEHLIFNIAFIALALLGILMSGYQKEYSARKNTA